jgi:ABC-2 type transport system ATP-binding protein
MIHVQHLTKHYAGVAAVRGVSFEVARGEVVGFLGPNGAGKSTTMRILAGFLAPSGGQVRVAGHDVTMDGLEVRRRLGYLPEHCPLYPEMRVTEYLNFRASLKGVPRRHRAKSVDRVLEQCSLTEVRRRPIGQLSKGFRQRVGIADALVHAPDLLILDEPTIGLDPNQIRLIRALIRDLAKQHTILLSTHILSEVEATCDRVLMMHQGRIVESAPLAEIEDRWTGECQIVFEVKAHALEVEMALRAQPGLSGMNVGFAKGWSTARLSFQGAGDPRETLFRLARDRGWPLRELHRERHSLEDLFASLTVPEKEGKA